MYFGLNQKPEHFTGLRDIMIKFLITEGLFADLFKFK